MAAKKLKQVEHQYLTMKEVMEKTHYSRRSIERFIKDGELRSVRIRRKRLIAADSFAEFINASTVDGKF